VRGLYLALVSAARRSTSSLRVESMTAEDEFRAAIRPYFDRLTPQLLPLLGALIDYSYPEEVAVLSFQIFSDGFTNRFPIRAFFIDRNNNEHFEYVDGVAKYPSPVDPGLLKVRGVYPAQFEAQFSSAAPLLDPWAVAADECVMWFSACWTRSGSYRFHRLAVIADHDAAQEFDLQSRQWQPLYASFRP
jgi:hypothetical protein